MAKYIDIMTGNTINNPDSFQGNNWKDLTEGAALSLYVYGQIVRDENNKLIAPTNLEDRINTTDASNFSQ